MDGRVDGWMDGWRDKWFGCATSAWQEEGAALRDEAGAHVLPQMVNVQRVQD